MLKTKILILILLGGLDVWAQPGKVVIEGAQGKPCVYNSVRGRGRMVFSAPKEQEKSEIILPEEQCNDLFYLIGGNGTSWIQVKPGETVTVDMSKKPWIFSGDRKEINHYLRDWTQKMFFDKPNMLIDRIQAMFHQVPSEFRQITDTKLFYTPEYTRWVDDLLPALLKDLKRAGLKDGQFVSEQQERIKYAWIELQLQNYQHLGQTNETVPEGAVDFAKTIVFDQEGLVAYSGCEDILRIFFGIHDEKGWLNYDHTNFLPVHAGRLAHPKVKEFYVLGELNGILYNNWLYQTDQVFASVADIFVTEEGKQKFAACKADYQKLASEDKAGEPLFRFEFEDKEGKTIRLEDFKGKYLFIDIWATWCGPCKYQIPYVMKLEKELASENIAFLSLSVDKQADKALWKDMVEKFGLEGYCAISPDAFEYGMFKQYRVTTIPRFMLIAPDGKVVMSKARRPSDPLLKLQLEELLGR